MATAAASTPFRTDTGRDSLRQPVAQDVVDQAGDHQDDDEARRTPRIEEGARQQGHPVPVPNRTGVVRHQQEGQKDK